MKIKIKTFVRGVTGLFLLAFLLPAQGAPLNLSTPFPDPDIITNGTGVRYIYDGDGTNTLTITGGGGAGGAPSSQFITIPGGNSLNGGNTAAISGQVAGIGNIVTPGSYILTANFDNAGNWINDGTSTVSVGGYVVNPTNFGQDTVAEAYFGGTNTGTVLTMNLTQFGFQGTPTGAGDRDTLLLEWVGDINGGDLFDLGFGGETGGTVALGNVFWGTTDASSGTGGTFGQIWDPLLINDMTAFTSSFVSCASGCPLQVDTFVPVPAAAWLFGSGLLGLAGVGARRRGKRQNTGEYS